MKGDDQLPATTAKPERIPGGGLRPDDRGQDEVREALEESIGQGESRPLTREEREATPHDSGLARTVYAPASERDAKAPLPADEQFINVEARLSASIMPDDHVQGPNDATVTLVQYGDRECPYTRMSRHSVHQLQREYPGTLRFVFRLDAARFEHDRRSSRVRERVNRDLASGEASGVQSTPTFYINGIRHDGSYDVDSLRSAVVGHLRSGSEHQQLVGALAAVSELRSRGLLRQLAQ